MYAMNYSTYNEFAIVSKHAFYCHHRLFLFITTTNSESSSRKDRLSLHYFAQELARRMTAMNSTISRAYKPFCRNNNRFPASVTVWKINHCCA
jgi:hypothetical protein